MEDAPFEDLTWREQEVLALLAERLTNREIAARLHLAESTVKDYVSNILGKLYVKNRRQAVERAEVLGLLEREQQPISGPAHNLPAETTPFIGRLDELEKIGEVLSSTRLLTLSGLGGVGKTRLALKAAANAVGEFEDGGYFVSLAPLPAAEHIIQTIAEAVDFPLATDEDPQRQLLRYLQKKQILLVMDNYEHLLDGAGIVSEILAAAPRVKILATSRERLNLSGETNLIVGGMDFPDQERSEDFLDFDAVMLFIQNARKIHPTFDPSLADLETIAHVCQSVQGMPLAIELAAGWLHILSLEEIKEELKSGLDLLSTQTRDAPARHRSIQAVFDHTWTLLNGSEQAVVLRLSVFRGGFTREAAQKVAETRLNELSGLVNKSVLLYRSDIGRFEIHELLRQYAQGRLETSQDAHRSAQEAHAAYFANFMQDRWDHLRADRQLTALHEIEADLENIRTAWRFFLVQAAAHQLEKFVHSFWLVYWIRGWSLAAVRLFEEAEAAVSRDASSVESEGVRALALAHQGFFLAWLGLADRGFALAQDGIQILEGPDRPAGLELALAYQDLTLPAYYLDRLVEESAAIEKMVAIARSLDDPWLEALAFSLSGLAAFRGQDYERTRKLAEASLRISEEIGDSVVPILSLGTLGHLAMQNGEARQAKGCFLQCLNFASRVGFRWAIGNSTKYLGQVALLEGDLVEAERYFLRSLRIADDLRLDRDIANHLYEFANLRAAQGRPEEALELLALLVEHPASGQARLGSGRIKDDARVLLGQLEAALAPAVVQTAIERGKRQDPDAVIARLLKQELRPIRGAGSDGGPGGGGD